MSLRSIGSRLAALLLAAGVLPSCGGGSAALRPDEGLSGDILKISYFRVNPEPKTKKPEPTYRVVMSKSWQDRIGESSREPIVKAAGKQIYRGFPEDVVMRRYVDKLRGMGLDQLRSRNPDDANPQEIYARAMNPQEGEFTRVITVGTDKSAKSYYYRDQQGNKESIEIFGRCEVFVISVMAGHTINIQIVTDPRDK